jgi:5'-methylthioadenosine phosphorylase
MKTLTTNASLSKHITASILTHVHDAVSSGQIASAEGSMKFSLMTPHEHVPKKELYKFKFILPEYFPYDEPDSMKRRASPGRVNTEDRDDYTGGVEA